MKYLKATLLLLGLGFVLPSVAQKNIEPGAGFGPVQLGMKITALEALIGEPTSIVAYAEEYQNYADLDYDPSKNVAFIIGFDEVYIFQNGNEFAVWKVYVKKNKIVYLNFSSYMSNWSVLETITVGDSLGFYREESEMEAIFGTAYVKETDPSGYVTYTYVEKGVRFLFEGTKMRNVFIFKPLKGKKATQFRDGISPAK